MSLLDDISRKQKEEYINQLQKPGTAATSDKWADYSEEKLKREQETSKWKINLNQYPADLGGPDTLHYVEFAINVRGKSEYNKENRLFQVPNIEGEAGLTPTELGRAGTAGIGIVGGVVGAKIGKKIFDLVPKTGSKPQPGQPPPLPKTPGEKAGEKYAGQVVGGAGGAIIAAGLTYLPIFWVDKTERISDVIALHIDKPPRVVYSMEYEDVNLGSFAKMLSAGISIEDGIDYSGAAIPAFLMNMGKLPAALGGTNPADILGASAGVALNPFKEAIFRSVNFRKFTFEYSFYPKSKAEAEQINKIIKLFKFHMHPELAWDSYFFIYPAEFQITYFFNGKENEYMHKLAPCVLTNMDVSYGGQQYSAFVDGKPTQVLIKLEFQETEILTKKMIESNY